MNAQDQQNSDRIVRNIDYLQVLKNRWKEVFLVFLLVLVISVVVTFLMPPSYRATSQFQIKLPKPVMEIGQGGDVVASSNVTANYIPMQYSVLTSTEVLKVVSRKLNLAAEWGMTDEMAASNLAGMIKVAPVRATDLVDVIVSGPDPKLVQNIAKAVPEAYKQDREMRENRLVETAIKSLKDVLREQEDTVNEKMMSLKKLIAESSYLPTTWRNGENRSTLTAGMEEEDFRNAKSQAMQFEKDEKELDKINQMISGVHPDLLIACFGCPKQEKWIYENISKYDAKVSVCAGATVDFLAGNVNRAPRWMSEHGLEWFYRFLQEPKRMFKRYFVDDVKIVGLIKKYR